MANILICGHRAYAAHGLKEVLTECGHNVFEFSRGELKREGNIITGPVLEIDKNSLFNEQVDIVVNFIFLQNGTIKENEDYISSLLKFCEKHRVGRLIQISSISSYPNSASIISEDSPIDLNIELKGRYGQMKVAADFKLEQASKKFKVNVIFVRAGYITAVDNPHPFKGIAYFIGSKVAILIGDKTATLPCVKRDILNSCLAEIVTQDKPLNVYLIFEKYNTTKYSYFRSQSDAFIVFLPKKMFFFLVDIAKILHILSERHICIIKGVFKVNLFDNRRTVQNLKSLQ